MCVYPCDCLSTCLTSCLPNECVCQAGYLSVYPCVWQTVYPYVCLPMCLAGCLPFWHRLADLSIHVYILSTCLSAYPCICSHVCLSITMCSAAYYCYQSSIFTHNLSPHAPQARPQARSLISLFQYSENITWSGSHGAVLSAYDSLQSESLSASLSVSTFSSHTSSLPHNWWSFSPTTTPYWCCLISPPCVDKFDPISA